MRPQPPGWRPRPRVLAELVEAHEPMTSSELAQATGLSVLTCNGALRSMMHAGEAERVGYRGRRALWVALVDESPRPLEVVRLEAPPRKTDPELARLGALLRQERERAGLSQVELAERAGVSQPTITRLERGSGGATALLAIAGALELRLELIRVREL